MKILRSVWPIVLLVAMSASLASCAEMSHHYANPDAQREAAQAQRDANRDGNAPRQRLNIQTGGGEPIVLPWFIQGAKDWVNN
jgi:anti-sigma factor RsiW